MKVKNIVKAFTLIELLVTIVVMSMLSSISVATLNGYAEKAKVSVIKRTVSDLYRVTVLYALEEDKYYSEISVEEVTRKFGIKEPEFAEIAYVASDTDFLYEASLPDGSTWTIGLIPKTYAKTAPIADTDKDGITDDKDLCPNDPVKETITYLSLKDSMPITTVKPGCPYVTYKYPDKDKDGVTDDVDQCPDTPRVETITYLPYGSPPPDTIGDRPGCPYTTFIIEEAPPMVAEKESEYYATGTKRAMTYFTSLDNETRRNFVKATYDVEIANTLMAAAADADFKYKVISSPWSKEVADADLDSIPDYKDACPDVVGIIELMGCPPVDTDKDGVFDHEDLCPNVSGDAYNHGCPLPDKDNDGVWDEEDGCPEEAGPKENKGCPFPDKDKDGVVDKEDVCPEEAGTVKAKGCPDKDDDGVWDKEDICPTEAGLAENKGCPIADVDTDKDGVMDKEDVCPTEAGPKENSGCPVKK